MSCLTSQEVHASAENVNNCNVTHSNEHLRHFRQAFLSLLDKEMEKVGKKVARRVPPPLKSAFVAFDPIADDPAIRCTWDDTPLKKRMGSVLSDATMPQSTVQNARINGAF